ncbi:hypothetical protein D3C75_789920 [compost metagenome]
MVKDVSRNTRSFPMLGDIPNEMVSIDTGNDDFIALFSGSNDAHQTSEIALHG